MNRVFHGFGGKLHHAFPSWVRDDAIFHIRIRCDAAQSLPLATPELAKALLDSVIHYESQQRWFARLFLLMPDHIHALLVFPPDESMANVIRSWKRFHARKNDVFWQEGFFDHRLRDHDLQWDHKRDYILRNPVVKGLCANVEDWPWKYQNDTVWPETRP
jgi:putative transposase